MVLHSFAELGKAFGIKQKPRRENVYTCRKCGCQMNRVGNTNVYFCPGKNSEGNPCMNRLILPVKKAQ